MRRLLTILVPAVVGLLLTPMSADARTASTTYRTRLGGVIPLKIQNINHDYSVGRGYLSIGKGKKYRMGIGRLTVRIPTKLGARLDRWMFKRFVFSNKNVTRTTRSSDGVLEKQWRNKVLTVENGVSTLSNHKKGVDIITGRDGKTTVRHYQPSRPGTPVSQNEIMAFRKDFHKLPQMLRSYFQGGNAPR